MANNEEQGPVEGSQNPQQPPTTGTNNNEEDKTATVRWLENYLEDPLLEKSKSAQSADKVNCVAYEEQCGVNQIKICRLQKAKTVQQEYEGIHHCVASVLDAHAGIVVDNVAAYKAKNEELKAKLDAFLGNLKETKIQLDKTRELACKLEGTKEDACFKDQINATSGLSTKNGKEGKERFLAEVAQIVEKTNSVHANGNLLFETRDEMASLQAMINLGTLEQLTSKLKEDVEGLVKNVTDNTEKVTDKLDACEEEYLEGAVNISASLHNRYQSTLQQKTLDSFTAALMELTETDCTEESVFSDITTKVEEMRKDGIAGSFSLQIDCSDKAKENKFRRKQP